MKLPEYQNNSIVNLVSSLLNSLGVKNQYEPLYDFNLNTSLYNTIVFIVIDGLGHNYLSDKKNSFLKSSLVRKITSVFPTTTASALTSFMTAKAPLQHAMTGWNMYFKELGCASLSLPFSPRFSDKSFEDLNINPSQIFNYKNIFDSLNIPYDIITPKKNIDSAYSNYSLSSKNKKGYETSNDFFLTLTETINKNILSNKSQTNIIYAYYPYFDEYAHTYGIKSDKCDDLYSKIDKSFYKLKNEYKNDNVLFIITADHGLIDVTKDKKLYLKNYPVLSSCLSLPLCGEARVPFCYIRPFKLNTFKNFVQNEMHDYCTLLSLEKALKINLFGLGEINDKFFERVGDYILIMKENYVLIDTVLNEKEHSFIGYHGGLTKDELYVPFIVF